VGVGLVHVLATEDAIVLVSFLSLVERESAAKLRALLYVEVNIPKVG